MTTPVKPQSFATGGNYPAGADAWSGQPRVVTMTDAEKAAGFTPNTPVSAERRNGLHAEHFQTATVLAHGAAQNWNREVLPCTSGGRNCVFNHLVSVAVPNTTRRAVVALGHDLNNSNHYVIMRSWGAGFNPNSVFDATPTVGPNAVSAGADGEWLANNVTGDIVSHTQLVGTKTTTAFVGTGTLHYAPGPAKYLATSAGSGAIYVASTIAGLAAVTGPAGLTAFTASTVGTPGGEFADNGASSIVYAGSCTVSGVTRFRLLQSSDGGATWSVRVTCSGLATALNVVWSSAKSMFVSLDSLGFVRTSPDGVTWTTGSTLVGLDTLYLGSARHRTMAAAGHCVAKVVAPDYYTATARGYGVLYTFDLLTWNYCPFGSFGGFDGSTLDLKTLISANGRFYATDGNNVFRSGILEV